MVKRYELYKKVDFEELQSAFIEAKGLKKEYNKWIAEELK